MKYEINGSMRIGRQRRKFSKKIEAESKKHATDLIYSVIGAQHGIRRTEIKIAEIKEV